MLELLLSALLPLGVQASKALINKFLGKMEITPATFDQAIMLAKIDIARLKAIAEIENSGETYKSVEAIRKLMRPFVVTIVLIVWASAHIFAFDNITDINKLAGMVFFYLFGDRSATYIFSGKTK